jgi:hypothetical protein
MRKVAVALVPILFAMMLFGIIAESVSAQRASYKPPQITILSPSSDETYNSSSVSLNVEIVTFGGYPWYHNITSLNYSLDGQQDVPISFATDKAFIFLGNDTLSIFSNGLHSVSVHGESIYSSVMGDKISHFNATASFTVDAPDTAFPSRTPAPDGFTANLLPIILSMVVVLVTITITGLAVYHKKLRKHR